MQFSLVRFVRLGLLVTSLCFGLGLAAPSSPAAAVTITCCGTSSDATPASLLEVVLDFAVAGSTLTLKVTNTSSSFRVNQIYFNASDDVTSLVLSSATHSAAGVVTSRWSVLADEDAGPFAGFDFGLLGGNGARPWVLDPSESVVLVLTIGGTGPFTDADFGVANDEGFQVAAKFQGGPPDPETPGSEDSAFGSVAEPGLLGLLALALLGVTRRRS